MKNAIRTITWRFRESSELADEFAYIDSVSINTPEDVIKYYHSLFRGPVTERLIVFWLDNLNWSLGFEIIQEGFVDLSLVHSREVFRGALVTTAASIVLAHNSCPGTVDPSLEDIAFAKRTVEAGKIIGIQVHDHIIFNGSIYISMADRGLL